MIAKNIIKIIIYLLIVIILLLNLSFVFKVKNVESPYIKKNSEPDVLFVGGSGTLRGISPLEIYNNYGIKTYIIGASFEKIPVEYYYIKENVCSSRNTKPKIIALDVESFFFKDIQNLDNLHYDIDYYPLSLEKIKFINEKIWNMRFIDKISFIFPVFRFHSRWDSIKQADFERQYFPKINRDFCYGYMPHKEIFKDSNINYMNNKTDENENTYKENYSEEYVLRVKDFCDKNNIKLIIYNLPIQSWSYSQHNLIENWAQKNGLEYIDFNTNINDTKLDLKNDFFDKNHLNIDGATKISNYFGNYLKNKSNLTDYRNTDNQWDIDAKEYINIRQEVFNEYNNNLNIDKDNFCDNKSFIKYK